MSKQIHVMMGIPGVGKSTEARRIIQSLIDEGVEESNILYLESDKVRADKEYPLTPEGHKKTFNYMMEELLNTDAQYIIYDATNLSRKKRRHNYGIVKQKISDVKVIIEVVIESMEIALSRNYKRDRIVPPRYIRESMSRFQPPRKGVDCDSFNVHSSLKGKINSNDILIKYQDTDKDLHSTPFHWENISKHTYFAWNTATIEYGEDSIHNFIAKYHDLGKFFTGVSAEVKGRADKWYHEHVGERKTFPGHQNVSSMIWMVDAELYIGSRLTVDEADLILECIFQHMQAHQGFTDKFIRRNGIDTMTLNYLDEFHGIDTGARLVQPYIHDTYILLRDEDKLAKMGKI